MTTGTKAGYKRKSRKMVRIKGKTSDESDEDYMVSEDEDEGELEDEFCLNSDGGDLEEEEEEGFVQKKVKKVKKVGRSKINKGVRSRGRNKNGIVKTKKKRRGFFVEDEDDDDEDDVDYNFDDEKINEVEKPRKKKRVSYSEEDDEYFGTDDDFDDVKVNKVVKSRKKKRVSYREEDDDFDDVKVNEVVKSSRKKRDLYREEDDDYEGMNEDFGDVKGNKVVKSKNKKRGSYKEEDEDVKVDKVVKRRKKKGVSYREEDDEYDGFTDDDDDDDEFTPDEIDGVDDEDELPVVTKNKRVGRRRIQGKGISKGQKRKRNSKVLKRTGRKKPRKNRGPRWKGITHDDGEFIDKKPIVEEKNNKVNGRRKNRRFTMPSDSDFVSSESSEYEFTISEEEREQIREANLFCRSSTTSLRTSSNKLEKKKFIPVIRKRPARKGKEKVEDLKVEAVKQVCGICLTEEGKRTVRGTLNCCSHYFCFVCIMEWSKVESRCPLCKQRFVTISKPARSNTGFDLRTVAIQIPERDQVYEPSEEELQGLLDPYDDVFCTECHQGGDDSLMLLCDLCDSPAHTYCVGLGHEVPEGNWYCEGCRPTALDSSNQQVSTPTPDYRTNSNLSVELSPVSSIRETFDLNEMYVPETPLPQETPQLPSPRPSFGVVQLPSPSSGSVASTVLGRRRIQFQIHQLRRRRMDDRNLETQVGQNTELAPQRIPSNGVFFHENLQENTTPLLGNPVIPSPRLNNTRGQPCENQPSTSTNRSFRSFSQNGFSGLTTRSCLGLDQQQLQPCSSRSNIGSDAGTSSFNIEKDQVQSMVKNHLQGLSKNLELGYNTFKEIARSSTHTILAACGNEHRRNEVFPVQIRLICTHVERGGNVEIRPNKGYCSSCFDSFVGGVVREIVNARVARIDKD